MSIADDIAKALDLDAKATKGPWTGRQPFAGFSAIHGKDDVLVFGLAAGGTEEKRPDAECEANQDLIASYRDLAPRLAAWAQQVMPLVEAAEELQKAEPGRMTPKWMSRYQDAVTKLLDAALALNLEVPR